MDGTSDDVLENMRWLLERLKADGDPDGSYRECKVALAAIAEIERLRSKGDRHNG